MLDWARRHSLALGATAALLAAAIALLAGDPETVGRLWDFPRDLATEAP